MNDFATNNTALRGNRIALAEAGDLTDLQVVRTVPNRRLVCRGVWNGQGVYAKIFMGADAEKYAKRDADGIAILLTENIATPALLHAGAGLLSTGEQVQVIVLKEIIEAETADALWPTLKPKARFELATNLIKVIATHHLNEVVHTDLHLKNFLVAKQFIYTLDGDGVRQFGELTYKQALNNLAELISKFDVLEQTAWLPELLESYCTLCAWHLPIEVAQVASLANRYRLKTASGYADKKVFRQCTDVSVSMAASQSGCGFWAWSNLHESPLNLNLDALLQSGQSLKSGNTCTVGMAQINDKKIVIKRYNIKNLVHAISRAFRPSRAAVSWANAHRLKLLNIATAQPVALFEKRVFGLRGKAYFLAEYIEAPDLKQFFAQTQNNKARADAVKNIVTLFYKLFLLQISHNDTKASNIKMVDNKPVLIDLDSMHQHRTYFRSSAAHLRDLKRFMQNWENDNALYNAFVKTFKVVYPDVSILVKAGIFQNKEIA